MDRITSLEYSHAELQDLVKDHICSVCGGLLTVAWNGLAHIIRCGNNKDHIGIRKDESYHTKIIRGYLGMDSTALAKLTEQQMIERVNLARFPQELTIPQQKVVAKVSIEYGLDPLMGELIMYYGSLYVTINGRRRKAQETNNLDGISSRPATKDEREARDMKDGDYLFKCEIRVKGAGFPFEGWGKVYRTEIERAKIQAENKNNDPWFLPLVKDPGDIAEKRAEAEALKRAFHLPIPSFEELIGQAPPAPAPARSAAPDQVRPELKTVVKVDSEADWKKADAAKAKQKRDPQTINDSWELAKACFTDYGLQPADICAELNCPNLKTLPDTPANCYRTIASVRG